MFLEWISRGWHQLRTTWGWHARMAHGGLIDPMWLAWSCSSGLSARWLRDYNLLTTSALITAIESLISIYRHSRRVRIMCEKAIVQLCILEIIGKLELCKQFGEFISSSAFRSARDINSGSASHHILRAHSDHHRCKKVHESTKL